MSNHHDTRIVFYLNLSKLLACFSPWLSIVKLNARSVAVWRMEEGTSDLPEDTSVTNGADFHDIVANAMLFQYVLKKLQSFLLIKNWALLIDLQWLIKEEVVPTDIMIYWLLNRQLIKKVLEIRGSGLLALARADSRVSWRDVDCWFCLSFWYLFTLCLFCLFFYFSMVWKTTKKHA